MKVIYLILLLNFSAQAQSVQPGMWKAKSVFKVAGFSLPPHDDEECITTDQAKDAKSTIVKELQQDGCKLLSWKVKGEVVDATLSCKNDQFDAKGNIHGRFTAKNYALNGEAEGTYQNILPATANLELNGHWVGDCKKKIKE